MLQLIIPDYKEGDVNGDKIPDKVYLTGNQAQASSFVQNITLGIEDGRTGLSYSILLDTSSGYNPTLFLGDFNGDGVFDILVSIDSGGSGNMQYHYIYTFLNNRPKIIFNYEEFNNAYKYKVVYKDYYLVDVINTTLDTVFTLDITYKGQEYLSQIYYENGRLIKPLEGWVNPLGSLWPVDIERDGAYELFAIQSIAGRYNADTLGVLQTLLKWNGYKFAVFYQFVAIYGQKLNGAQ